MMMMMMIELFSLIQIDVSLFVGLLLLSLCMTLSNFFLEWTSQHERYIIYLLDSSVPSKKDDR
jgi:hypothetical protein